VLSRRPTDTEVHEASSKEIIFLKNDTDKRFVVVMKASKKPKVEGRGNSI
jgi:hypothetical protein